MHLFFGAVFQVFHLDRDTVFEFNGDARRRVRCLFRGYGTAIDTFVTYCARIFKDTGFMGNVQQVVIFTIRLGCCLLGGNPVFFGIARRSERPWKALRKSGFFMVQ